jgi:hypothetical protein
MDDLISQGKHVARQIAPDGPNSLWMDLEAAYALGTQDAMKLLRDVKDAQLVANRALVGRLGREIESLLLDVKFHKEAYERELKRKGRAA